MLTIRHEQMAALVAPHRERFVRKMLADLAKLFPGDPRLEDEPATRAMIEDAVARAAVFDLEGTRELGLFIYLVHDYGPGFETAPDKSWMGALLRDQTLEARVKLDVIYARLEAAARGRTP
jgi:hypothetical protein